MELIKTLKGLKKEIIKYIVEIANNHCLDYLYKEKIDNVYRYCFVIDYKVICTYNLEETLEQQSTDSLVELYEKIEEDISCVLPPYCESGHKHKLVGEINKLYKEQHEDFINILQFLMKRDREIFKIKNFDIEDKMFIDKQATMILINLCNNDDLQCIISYCKGKIIN